MITSANGAGGLYQLGRPPGMQKTGGNAIYLKEIETFLKRSDQELIVY